VVTGAGVATDPTFVDPTPVRVDPVNAYPPEPRQPSFATRLDWRWPQFGLGQFVLTGVQGALAVGAQAIPGELRFNGVNAFDDAIRNALRLDDYEAHLYARDASDVGFVLLFNHRLIDTLLVTWWFHDKGSTAFEMGLLDLQALTFAAGVQQMTAGIAGRERPYGRSECGEGGRERDTTDCLGNNRYRSFFSGHTTLSFTLASLTCMHHAHLPIYGGGAIEAVPCVASMAVASAVSTLRIVADQHYATDVLLGVAFGLASGLSIPYLFAYGQAPLKDAMTSVGLPKDVFIMPTPAGVTAGGLF
jgi:hypothetical protein